MNKEFIPYEQALDLKELGFNETCLAQYKKYDVGEATLDIGFSKNEIIMQFHKLSKFCSAPLYQQTFRWFREKYLFFSIVFYHTDERTVFKNPHYFRIYESKNNGKKIFVSKNYRTYEEAELECLKKLIEIAKTTNDN